MSLHLVEKIKRNLIFIILWLRQKAVGHNDYLIMLVIKSSTKNNVYTLLDSANFLEFLRVKITIQRRFRSTLSLQSHSMCTNELTEL